MSAVAALEADKYRRMWAVDDYRSFSPGLKWLPLFLDMAGTERGRLLDVGCGTGQAGDALASKGFDVTLFDLVRAGVEVETLPFVEGPIWGVTGTYDWGYCCDVMEHIPTEYTLWSASVLVRACRRVFFTIATEPDQFGVRVGDALHLTVQPFAWWRDRLRDVGHVREARDCLNTAVFLVERWA